MLPRRITGFWAGKTEPPPSLDEKAFRRMCHTLARENGGTVTEVDTDTTARNFFFAEIRKRGTSVFLLQNSHYPYAAFAQRDAAGEFVLVRQPEYVRIPEGLAHFLSLAELNQDWRGLCGELSPEEREQICYWRPRTVGEMIFNTWD